MFHNRDAAYDPRVIAALQRADGIFLAGGDQSNYIRYWKGTPVQAALNAHVNANRPIGGSSAGLAVLGHYSYTAFDGGSMESKVALANPFDGGVTLESDFLHLRRLETSSPTRTSPSLADSAASSYSWHESARRTGTSPGLVLMRTVHCSSMRTVQVGWRPAPQEVPGS